MTEYRYVEANKLRPGPIQHESLPPELLEQIRAIHELVGRHLGFTMEQFELCFKRDIYPETEVAIWRSISATWIDYHKKHLGGELLPDEDETKLVTALNLISMGVGGKGNLGVSEEVG